MERLRCVGLRKSFDGVVALEDVQLQCPATGIIGLMGPNGAGKTTLLNILTGFLEPDVGQCFLGARETTGLPPYRIARLGIARTFQEVRLIAQISVLENILLARPRQRAERILRALLHVGLKAEEVRSCKEAQGFLATVGLEDKASQLAGGLSYGEQKLLTLACCLAMDADIMLLDEPIAGIHPQIAATILELLRGLRSQGKLVVLVEHDIAAVRAVADHVIVMNQGKIVADGTPSEVLDRPKLLEAYVE